MSWYVFWILDLPLKEASGDSEDQIQEDNANDSWQLDENDTGSCCSGGGNGSYNSDDDDKTEVWFFSKEALQHRGEVYNEISLEETEAADAESRQQKLKDDAKDFWEACIAHGY
jgi:hypothetical protein